jgi:hypothetical protein
MSKTSATANAESAVDLQVKNNFERGMSTWASAIDAHKMAPPDHDFAERLAALADGAKSVAAACREAEAAGYEWPPARKADSEPPYELRPDTGRRGPVALWKRFDQAVMRLRTAAAGTDMLQVSRAYDQIAELAGKLAAAVTEEDRAPRPRARRSA